MGSWKSVAAALISRWVPQTYGQFMCWTCSLMVDRLTGIKYWENTPELRLIWLMVWLLMGKWWSSVCRRARDVVGNKQFLSHSIAGSFPHLIWRKLSMVLLLKVDCLDINFGLGGITDILISSLGFSSQHCFRFPGPANFSLSLQNTQTPQSNCVHLSQDPHRLLFTPGTTMLLFYVIISGVYILKSY